MNLILRSYEAQQKAEVKRILKQAISWVKRNPKPNYQL